MADFFRLLKCQDELIDEYFLRTQEANEAYDRERAAAIRIQRVYRGALVRGRFHDVVDATCFIQRVARGKQARNRCKSILFDRENRKNNLFFDYCAKTIQKFFRGHSSRKNVHSFYARKAYLQSIAETGEKTNSYLRDRLAKMKEMAEKNQNDSSFAEFQKLTRELHHLVSTQSQPGIYNGPYQSDQPRAFGDTVEAHLKNSLSNLPPLKSLNRPQRPKFKTPDMHPPLCEKEAPEVAWGKKPLVTHSANAGRRNPVAGPFRNRQHQAEIIARNTKNFTSVQMSSKFDVVEKSIRMQDRLAKLTHLGNKDFVCRKPPHQVHLPSIRQQSQWGDRNLEFREDITNTTKMNKPPFFTTVDSGQDFWQFDPNKSKHVPGRD